MRSVGRMLNLPQGACNLIEVSGHGYTDKLHDYVMLNVCRQKCHKASMINYCLSVMGSSHAVSQGVRSHLDGGDLSWWWGS